MSRLENLRAKMQEAGLASILLTDELNQRYLTGYAFTDGYVFVTQNSAYMLTDFRYFEEASAKVQDLEVVMPQGYFAEINRITEKEGLTNIGYEDITLSCAEKERLSGLLDAPLLPMGGLMNELRMVKSEDELVQIRAAQKITDDAFSHILKVLTPNMTEVDVALELEFYMRKNGAEGVSFETIAVSGSASALPHGKCRYQKLEKGFLTMDFGCKVNGYCSDMTRTVVLGKADAEIRRVYETVRAAQTAALEVIGPEMDGAFVDAAARSLIDGAGYEGCFGHGLGHGVGLYIHEAPRLSRAAKGQMLKKGHVVTVEPGIYLSGKYGCRIEDMGVITENGYEDFTHSPKELIELF